MTELRGLNDFLIWRYDDNDQVLTDTTKGGIAGNMGDTHKGIFKVDMASSYGATQGNVTGLAGTLSATYGSNGKAENDQGAISPSVALGANDIPHEVYDAFAGLTADKLGGVAYKKNFKVNGGLILHSYNPNHNFDVYVAFPIGVFTPGEMALATDAESPVKVHDALTFGAQQRGGDNMLYSKFYGDATGFDYDKMIDYITGVDMNPVAGAETHQTVQTGSNG